MSLQKGESAEQVKEVGWPIIDWMGECDDMQDTGALIENLDLAIVVNTSMVHLAGALGCPAWLLSYGNDWRWMREGDSAPWYPTARVFRQPVSNDREEVVARGYGRSFQLLSVADGCGAGVSQ